MAIHIRDNYAIFYQIALLIFYLHDKMNLIYKHIHFSFLFFAIKLNLYNDIRHNRKSNYFRLFFLCLSVLFCFL